MKTIKTNKTAGRRAARIFHLTMVFFLLALQPGFAQYQSFSSQTNVDVNKKWTISFSKQLDPSSITSGEGGIRIVDEYGLDISTIVNMLSDQKSVEVSPASSYDYNSRYTLVVEGVRSAGQDELVMPAQKNFTTKSPGISVVDSVVEVVADASAEKTSSYKGKVELTIPANTVSAGAPVTIQEIAGASLHEFTGVQTLSTHDISVGDETSFENDLTIRLKYDPDELRAEYEPDEQLTVAHFDEEMERWVESEFEVDEQAQEIVVSTDHLTLWSLFGMDDDTVMSTGPNFRIYFNENINAPRFGDYGADPVYDFAAHTRKFLIEAKETYEGLGINVPEMTKVYIDDWGADKTAEWGWFSKNIEIPVSYFEQIQLKHDCAHEYFHAVQNEYVTSATMMLNRWWMEASADYAAAGLVGTGMFSHIDGNYLDTPMGTVDGSHEYKSARFVDYLVSEKGVDFKKLWEYTANSWNPDMMESIDSYLKSEHSISLADCYGDFARYLVFSNESPAYSGAGSITTPWELSAQSEMPLSVKNLEKTMSLSEYTAKIWAIKPEMGESSPSRTLLLELGDDLASGVDVDVFLLHDYQWRAGDMNPDAVLSDPSKSEIVKVSPGEIVFVMVSNAKDSSASVDISVKELDFSVTPSQLEGEIGKACEFKIEAANIPKETDIVSMEWNFGDAQTEDEDNLSVGSQLVQVEAGSADAEISHKYAEAGEYRLEVEMKDLGGKVIASAAAEIEIPEQEVEVSILAPRIVTYELAPGASEAVHDFQAQASPQGSYTFEWDFGDGSQIKTTTGSDSSVSHTYSETGSYYPKVTLYGESGEYLGEDSISVTLEELQADYEVDIPDAGLESAVRSALGKPSGPIMKSDMEKMTELNAQDMDIKSLSGLKHATNLKVLTLYFNDVTDLSPIAGITSLEELYVSGNDNLVDLTPLSGLVNLRNFYFNNGWGNGNHVDITPLKNLESLENLSMSNHKVGDLSALSNLKNLKELSITDSDVTDIGPVSGLSNLEWLILRENPISDISPVSGLTSLTLLELNDCSVSDISPVSGLYNLESLQMGNNSIDDLTPVSGLLNLESIGFSNNYVKDLSPLENLVNLKRLLAWNNPLNAKSDEVIDILEERGCDVDLGW